MSIKPTVIYTAANLPARHILRNLLEDLGIPSRVTNDAVQQAVGDIPAGWATAPRVVVAEEHAELARCVALEFDAHGHESPRDDEVTEESEQTVEPGESPQQQPLLACPSCGSGRQAVSAYCGTSGNDFISAESAGDRTGGSRGRWLTCSTCQEPFAAQV